MNIMTKRGSQDNVVTYEHICDTSADMVNIDPNYITLGSICIVINGEDGGMEVYMANSNKEWNSIAMGAGSGDSGSGASSLVELLDVEVLNPTDGQTLTYDATAQKWINGGGGGGSTGGVMVVHATSHYDEENDTTYYTADKSFDEVASFIENGGIPILSIENNKIAQCDEISRDSLDNIDGITFKRISVAENSITYMRYDYYIEDSSIPNYIEYLEGSYSGSGESSPDL